ncbi:MAG: tetratricopeptide repeat protein [Planctomycetota bacterium]
MRAPAILRHGIVAGAILFFVSCSSLVDDVPDQPEFLSVNDDGSRFEGDAELYKQNAIAFYDAGDYYRARNQFKKILKTQPDDAVAKGGYAYCCYSIGFNEAAFGNFNGGAKNLIIAERTFESLYSGELPASTADGTGREWRNALGLAMTWRALASLDKMRSDSIDRVLGEGGARNGDKLLAEQKKRDLRRRDLNQKSLELFRRLATMEYAAPDAILNQGDLELIVGNTNASLRAYERYLSVARKNIENWDRRLEEWPEQYASDKYALEAQKAINGKRSAAVSKAVDVLTQVAEVHYAASNYADSLALLTEAAELNPRRVALNVPIAECYERLGEPKEALRHIEAYIKSNPEIDDNTRRAYRLRARVQSDLGS